jgi:UDP-N-acetylmuramate dehydrogenase
MEINTHIPLKNYTTMRLGGPARFITDIYSVKDLQSVYKTAVEKGLNVFVIGGGSNLLAPDEGFDGLVIRIRIPGFSVDQDQEGFTIISVGAGESWDETVKKTVEMRLSGIEAMSAIPGTVGAAPVQNVGAYGQEMADTLVSVEVFDRTTGEIVTLSHQDCGFSYRHSIFRGEQQGRYIITKVTMKLWKSLPAPPFYESLQAYFDTNGINVFTHQIVRDAVIEIRKEKLPDPSKIANSGSFFKNPIVEQWQFDDINQRYPNAKAFPMADGRVKIPAGWLIEIAGLKGSISHGIRVYEKNALVLINESAQSYNDLAEARDEIITKIRDMFQIVIEQEPLEVR